MKTATFTYAADGQRRKMVVGNTTTVYCDDYQVNKTGSTEQRLHYISGPAGLCALIVQNYNNGSLASRATYYLQTDYQGSIIAAYNSNGTLYKRFAYDPWGRRRAGDNWTNYQASTETLITRGYCGHEHLDDFGTINMNGRIYDPRLGRFLSPDLYVQAPYNSQNYNRYAYCLNNPLKYTDPSGEIAWFLPIVIGAAIFGTGNLATHAIKGDVNNFRDGLRYFGQGAIVGAALGAVWQFAPLIPKIGQAVQTGMTIYGKVHLAGTAISAIGGLGQGLFENDWSAFENTGKIFMGNFYIDENRSFFGGVWQGISRHTWEFPQTGLGHSWTQIKNAFGKVDRVDYLGGATFSTYENQESNSGMSLGNFINVSITDEIGEDFENRVISDPLFMHEYGHTFDSQIFGISYLLTIGIPSIISASGASQVQGEPSGVSTHDFRWYEMKANRHAARYFGKFYGVDWLSSYRKGTIETYYPRKRR